MIKSMSLVEGDRREVGQNLTKCDIEGGYRLLSALLTSYHSHPEDRQFFSGSMKSRSGSRVLYSGSFLDMISYHKFCPDRNTYKVS